MRRTILIRLHTPHRALLLLKLRHIARKLNTPHLCHTIHRAIPQPETALSADEVKAKFIWPCNIYLTDGGMVDDWITMQPIEEQATPAPEPAPEANAADVARAKLELATLAALMGNTPTALQIYQSAEKQGSTLSLDCQAILTLIDNTRPDSTTHAEALLRRAELRQDFYAPALLTTLQDLPTRSGSDGCGARPLFLTFLHYFLSYTSIRMLECTHKHTLKHSYLRLRPNRSINIKL